jgi:hypothetical protein
MQNLVAALVLLLLLGRSALAAQEEASLLALRERVATDVRAGRPLVAQVHTALCSNEQIRCGGSGLGDGDSLERNLYWATTGGTAGWFTRRGSGWLEAKLGPGERAAIQQRHAGVLDARVWFRDIPAGEPFRRLGLKGAIRVYVVSFAWRGADIDRAIDAYAHDLLGQAAESVHLADGTELHAGGGAQIVAYVGHSRWMDRDDYKWPEESSPPPPVKGTLAVACMTKQYVASAVVAPRRVPLLFTRDFVFAGTMPVDGALRSFAAGGSLAGIRAEAIRFYAEEEKKPLGHVGAVFTNPSDSRW